MKYNFETNEVEGTPKEVSDFMKEMGIDLVECEETYPTENQFINQIGDEKPYTATLKTTPKKKPKNKKADVQRKRMKKVQAKVKELKKKHPFAKYTTLLKKAHKQIQ